MLGLLEIRGIFGVWEIADSVAGWGRVCEARWVMMSGFAPIYEGPWEPRVVVLALPAEVSAKQVVLAEPVWASLRAVLFSALRDYPEAARVLAEAVAAWEDEDDEPAPRQRFG